MRRGIRRQGVEESLNATVCKDLGRDQLANRLAILATDSSQEGIGLGMSNDPTAAVLAVLHYEGVACVADGQLVEKATQRSQLEAGVENAQERAIGAVNRRGAGHAGTGRLAAG